MEHPLEWGENYMVLLAAERAQLSGMSSIACRVGSRADDLRAWQARGDEDGNLPELCTVQALRRFETHALWRGIAKRAWGLACHAKIAGSGGGIGGNTGSDNRRLWARKRMLFWVTLDAPHF